MQIVRAFSAQALGLLLALVLVRLTHLAGMWPLVGMQAAAAAGISRMLRQPVWWVPLHLAFLPAAMGMLALQLPSTAYLAGFLLLALVFWGTVKGEAPLFLSSAAVAQAVALIARREDACSFVDLGAGTGSVVIPLARACPHIRVEAWEHAPLPWIITRLRARKLPNLCVARLNLWHGDLSTFDVVFAFLSPAPMPAIAEKIGREMRPGSLFVSSSFAIPGWAPESVVRVDDRRRTPLYCYRIKGECR